MEDVFRELLSVYGIGVLSIVVYLRCMNCLPWWAYITIHNNKIDITFVYVLTFFVSSLYFCWKVIILFVENFTTKWKEKILRQKLLRNLVALVVSFSCLLFVLSLFFVNRVADCWDLNNVTIPNIDFSKDENAIPSH